MVHFNYNSKIKTFDQLLDHHSGKCCFHWYFENYFSSYSDSSFSSMESWLSSQSSFSSSSFSSQSSDSSLSSMSSYSSESSESCYSTSSYSSESSERSFSSYSSDSSLSSQSSFSNSSFSSQVSFNSFSSENSLTSTNSYNSNQSENSLSSTNSYNSNQSENSYSSFVSLNSENSNNSINSENSNNSSTSFNSYSSENSFDSLNSNNNVNDYDSKKFLTFTNTSNQISYVRLNNISNNITDEQHSIIYKRNNSQQTEQTEQWYNVLLNSSIQLSPSESISFFNNKSTLNTKDIKLRFDTGHGIYASGYVNSMINFAEATPYCFSGLFENCQNLFFNINYTTSENEVINGQQRGVIYGVQTKIIDNLQLFKLELPNKVPEHCCEGMFKNCKSMASSPALYSQKLSSCCYKEMFSGCNLLTQIKAAFVNWDHDVWFDKFEHNFTLSSFVNNIIPDSYKWEDALTDWVKDVNASGYFIGQGALTITAYDNSKTIMNSQYGTNRLPENWERQYITDDNCPAKIEIQIVRKTTNHEICNVCGGCKTCKIYNNFKDGEYINKLDEEISQNEWRKISIITFGKQQKEGFETSDDDYTTRISYAFYGPFKTFRDVFAEFHLQLCYNEDTEQIINTIKPCECGYYILRTEQTYCRLNGQYPQTIIDHYFTYLTTDTVRTYPKIIKNVIDNPGNPPVRHSRIDTIERGPYETQDQARNIYAQNYANAVL